MRDERAIIDKNVPLITNRSLRIHPGDRRARQYSERDRAPYGSGLLPDSAPMVEDLAEFRGRHFLGRSWRRRLSQ